MKKVLAALAGATMLLAAGVAMAAEVKGAIKAFNIETRTIQVNDVTVVVPQNVSLSGFTTGANVLITYTTAGGVNTATAIAKVAK